MKIPLSLLFLGFIYLSFVVCQSDYRPIPSRRTFNSTVIEKVITDISSKLKDPQLALLFRDCFPNTLDTTVNYTAHFDTNGSSDTFVITGDIPALWLRDSTNQVLPYVQFAPQDSALEAMLIGLINRHVRSVLIDPYANGFCFKDEGGPHSGDTRKPPMNNKIFEGKYELDSIAAVLKLSFAFFNATKNISPFNSNWLSAIDAIMNTIEYQQSGTVDQLNNPQYTFLRETTAATDTLMLNGFAAPGKRNGMSRSHFRPSDDACTLPFPIGANAMAAVSLSQIADLLKQLGQSTRAQRALNLSSTIQMGISNAGIMNFNGDQIFAYEADGYGNYYFMDDANIPGLLSLPYLGYIAKDDPLYLRTRKHILSFDNPYFSSGKAGKGVGGPHEGLQYIWPMSITIQALTSTDDNEILSCLDTLKSVAWYGSKSTPGQGYGFMHESFNKDNANDFTRPWFAWANSLFGELILTLAKEKPYLIF